MVKRGEFLRIARSADRATLLRCIMQAEQDTIDQLAAMDAADRDRMHVEAMKRFVFLAKRLASLSRRCWPQDSDLSTQINRLSSMAVERIRENSNGTASGSASDRQL